MGLAGAGNPVVGATYCAGGAFSLEQCDKRAEAVGVRFCDAGGCTDNQVRFTNGGGLRPGDSGGPFYFRAAGGCVYARGTLVGVGDDHGYAQMWSSIAAALSVSIKIDQGCY